MAALPPQLQTPGSEAGGSAGDEKTPANWNSKKFRDDFDNSRTRLVDQRFDPKQFPDPLLPRSTVDLRNNPKSSTPEIEKKFDLIIADYKD
ncbi:hypothetical protein C8035_v000273 [Colletotrichum spinosum]|nr:hypothetical protein C8035_v000273 [Colletotrichum spinosum]